MNSDMYTGTPVSPWRLESVINGVIEVEETEHLKIKKCLAIIPKKFCPFGIGKTEDVTATIMSHDYYTLYEKLSEITTYNAIVDIIVYWE